MARSDKLSHHLNGVHHVLVYGDNANDTVSMVCGGAWHGLVAGRSQFRSATINSELSTEIHARNERASPECIRTKWINDDVVEKGNSTTSSLCFTSCLRRSSPTFLRIRNTMNL
ncbi:hypothetical protein COOONC_07180 [Cooperia oncophora]